MVHSHSIFVLSPDSNQVQSWHELYDKIMQHISDGYAVAFVGEESEMTIMQHFLDRGISIEEHIKKGLLTIINRDVFYSPFVPSKILLEQWNKLFASIEKKVGRGTFKGFVAMGMPADSFFISDVDNQQLVRYESLAAKKYDQSLEATCIYTTEMLQKMPLRYVLSLLNAHQNTYHRGGRLREWNTKRALALVKQGLDSALGANVSELVLPIMIRDFGMNEDAIVLYPDQFERKLAILLGSAAADLVIDHIKAEITRDVTDFTS